jgi:flagellar hook-associated protein 2
MESSSNSVSDVLEGVVFSIQSTGTAQISVSTDIASVEESIQTFLDAVNSIIYTVQSYTAYDADKETTSNDPDDIGNDNYSASQLTSEKGGLLQGNYGVQLFSSRFSSLLGSAPPGFQSRTSASDLLSGDVLANLANMGIKTDTDENSDTYGLLVIAPDASIAAIQQMDQENYKDMINNNLEAVVDFFCSSGTGASTSSSFRYNSHVSGITQGGTYDVSYSVDAEGNIEHVYVGGVEATRDTSQPGYYYSVASGDARGLSLSIDDLSEGTHSGQIRIKEGLIPTVNSFLKSELTYNDVSVGTNATDSQIADAVYLKSQNGALMVLQANYKTIMENIDDKISKEQDRLELWESRQKTYFANLETLLSEYSSMQDQLESQIAQLSNSDD